MLPSSWNCVFYPGVNDDPLTLLECTNVVGHYAQVYFEKHPVYTLSVNVCKLRSFIEQDPTSSNGFLAEIVTPQLLNILEILKLCQCSSVKILELWVENFDLAPTPIPMPFARLFLNVEVLETSHIRSISVSTLKTLIQSTLSSLHFVSFDWRSTKRQHLFHYLWTSSLSERNRTSPCPFFIFIYDDMFTLIQLLLPKSLAYRYQKSTWNLMAITPTGWRNRCVDPVCLHLLPQI